MPFFFMVNGAPTVNSTFCSSLHRIIIIADDHKHFQQDGAVGNEFTVTQFPIVSYRGAVYYVVWVVFWIALQEYFLFLDTWKQIYRHSTNTILKKRISEEITANTPQSFSTTWPIPLYRQNMTVCPTTLKFNLCFINICKIKTSLFYNVFS